MSKEVFDKGLAIRTEVLGAAYVEKALKNADDFNKPLQNLVTEYCWGAVWGREGLSRRDRSLMNICMLSALNRPHELKTHIKASQGNGLTKAEVQEAILQIAIYCGVPVAIDSMRVAKEAFAELDAEKKG